MTTPTWIPRLLLAILANLSLPAGSHPTADSFPRSPVCYLSRPASASPQISANLALVAASQGVEFLDLQDMLAGREVCSRSTSHGVGLNAEWARFLVTGLTQGDAQESMHPNAIGQRALATCLDLLAASAPGSYRCFNNAGQGPEAMTLQ